MENQEHEPTAWNEYQPSYGSTKPRTESDSLAVGCGVVAVIVLFLTILALVVTL
jgi:hypothetical protein